ncbi:MAG: alpha/beta hydrolase [Candidatus Gracilibacteria bacterium]|nr:alpha/beta hydrolase [Candidatus Gracilibacteria bacterium]
MIAQKTILNGLSTSYCISENFSKENSLLFLHGWGQTYKSFESIYKILDENNISYVGLDFPGFGMTDFPKTDFEIFDYANFTSDFIEKLELKNPTLIGHSFGGRVSIILGAKSENIEKIILIGAAGIKPKGNPNREKIVSIAKAFFSLPGLSKIGEKLKDKFSSRDYLRAGKLKNIFLKVINTDLTEYLPKINKQTLLIRGDLDAETPISDGKLMNKLIPDSKLKVYKNGTHFVFQEFSTEVSNDIIEFIK